MNKDMGLDKKGAVARVDVTLSSGEEWASRVLPALVDDAVLVDPTKRRLALEAVDLAATIRSDQVLADAAGVDVANIIDLSRPKGQIEEEVVGAVGEWLRTDVLNHEVDVAELFPRWLVAEMDWEDGNITRLVSPIVTIDPTRYWQGLGAVGQWCEAMGIMGKPQTVVVLPDKWIKGTNTCRGHAMLADGNMHISHLDKPELAMEGSHSALRHEFNHIAVAGDLSWSEEPECYSRSVVEGVDLWLEMRQYGQGDAGRENQRMEHQIRNFKERNGYILGENRRGWPVSAVRLYKVFGIDPIEYNERTMPPRGSAEFYLGLFLIKSVADVTGGIEGVKRMYRDMTTARARKNYQRGIDEETMVRDSLNRVFGEEISGQILAGYDQTINKMVKLR